MPKSTNHQPKPNLDTNRNQTELIETVIQINRTSKKTKGGDRLRFSALTVVGDGQGRIGVELANATAVISAIRKANRKAQKRMFTFPIVGDQKTIPHRIESHAGASHVLLKPAPAGTGIRAGGPVRLILEAGGIQNIVAKILGSKNIKGNVNATIKALQSLKVQKEKFLS